MNGEHSLDVDVPKLDVQYEVPENESAQQLQAPELEDDSRRGFFRTIAGAAGAMAVQSTAPVVTSQLAARETISAANTTTEALSKSQRALSLGSTATSFVSREAPIVSRDVSRRAIIPVAGAVALSSVPRSMNLIKKTLRSIMWNG